jgi:cobalamin synthase
VIILCSRFGVARWLAALLIVLFPYARAEGRAARSRGRRGQAAIASGIAAVISECSVPFILPRSEPPSTVLGVPFQAAGAGGLTGDVYGAAIEWASRMLCFARS